jgi:glucoamylase
MSESSFIHPKFDPPFTPAVFARFSMKLATVLHSLGLPGSVVDLSKTIITVDTYIEKETPIAKSRLLANIGPDGVNSHGALVLYLLPTTHPWHVFLIHVTPSPQAGLVIASPNTQNPDYLYSWTRDSALVFKLLIEDFVSGDGPSLRRLIDAYISVEAVIQQVTNPSGTAGKSGLGEPKFNIDGSAFTAPWGRPQRGVCGCRVFVCQIRAS